MKKRRIKPSWKSLTIDEKIAVISFYIIGFTIIIIGIIRLYLICPLFW